jgi:PAS domain S-box-containing protein
MDGIVGCDAHERIVTFNQAAADMLDVRRESALGRPLADYFPPDRIGRWREALDGPSHGGPGRLNLFESEMTGPGGVKVPVQLSAVRIEEEAGAGGLVFFVRDLRAIRRLEREMADQAHVLHQDKMMSLGRLAASVVHEINNPLSGVLNYVRLMRRTIDRGPLDDRQIQRFRGNLETVEAETARVSEIAANLLAFSRRPAAHMTDLDLPALVQRAASLCRHRLELDHIELEVDFDQNTPPVRGDANQIQQCLINLIFNARDAMPQGGRVTVSVRNDGPGQVAVQVADTGPGVPSELRPHLFEPFFTTKDEGYGVGLGLSTVYGIAAHHGGRIDVGDAPGGGAVFTLRLPARSDQET